MLTRRQVCLLAALGLLVSGCSTSKLPPDAAAANTALGQRVTAGASSGAADGSATVPGAAASAGGVGDPTRGGGGSAAVPSSGSGSAPAGAARSGSGTNPPAAASTVGVTKTSITLTFSGLLSGPYGPIVSQVADAGFGTWVKDVNARGGIYGRQVVMRKVDNQSTADGAVAACKEESTNGTFAVFEFVGDPAEADCLEKAGVPTLLQAGTTLNPGWKHVRTISYPPHGGPSLASYMANTMGSKGRKIGVIALKTAIHTAIAKDFVSSARSMGLNVVDVEYVEQNQATYISELQRLRAAGAQDVAVITVTEMIGIIRDARALAYQPRWTGEAWIDEMTEAMRNTMDGVTGLRYWATTDSAVYKDFAAKVGRYGGNAADATATNMMGYGSGMLMERALRAAGPELTRASFDAGLQNLRNADVGVYPPVTFAGGSLVGTDASFPIACCNADYTWKTTGAARVRF